MAYTESTKARIRSHFACPPGFREIEPFETMPDRKPIFDREVLAQQREEDATHEFDGWTEFGQISYDRRPFAATYCNPIWFLVRE